MKRTVFAAVAVLFFAVSANAQLSVGFGYANIGSFYEKNDTESINAAYVSVMNSAVITKNFSINTGLKYEMGSKKNSYSLLGNGTQTEAALQIPVEFNGTFNVSNSLKIGAFVGPYAGFGIISKYKYEVGNLNATIDWHDKNNGTIYSYDRFDVGALAGVHIDIMNSFRIKADYSYGLIDLDPKDNQECYTRNFTVGIAYIF